MAYTTQENIESRIGELTADQAAYFTNVMSPAIDAYIDSVTETNFGNAESDDVTFYVNGTGTNMLTIPTMSEVTSVSHDGDVINESEYVPFPQGSAAKLAIRKKDGTWSCGDENYVVVGKAGYSTIPADITMIATELAVNGLQARTDSIKSEKTGDWAVTYAEGEQNISPRSLDILQTYRRLSRSI